MKDTIKVKSHYTVESLARAINDLMFDNEIKTLHGFVFDFDDCDVDIHGFVHGTFDYCFGDYYTPHSEDLIGQFAEIDSVVLGYAEETKILNNRELVEIEENINF